MLEFRRHPGEYAVCRLDAAAAVPGWALEGGFCSITRTPAELSVVCRAAAVPMDARAQSGWALLELVGPFPFNLTGVLESVLRPLAAAEVPIFALSTYDTDWLLVPTGKLAAAVQALRDAGHNEV